MDPAKVSTAVSEAAAASTSGPDDGHRFIEQFNADMMQQFLAHQVRLDTIPLLTVPTGQYDVLSLFFLRFAMYFMNSAPPIVGLKYKEN